MFKNANILVLFIFLITFSVQAQVDSIQSKTRKDTVATLYNQTLIPAKVIKHIADTFNLKTFKPDPLKVVWMAAILPGYGQIMNRKYWKLPIVYGGFLGCAYAISWNSGMYQSYFNAYRDIIANDLTSPNILQLIAPRGYKSVADFPGGQGQLTTVLNTSQQNYHRYRDLSIIITVGVYALSIIDAYVDAQLYDFDISPDLSMHIQPALLRNQLGVPNTLGMQCSINLK